LELVGRLTVLVSQIPRCALNDGWAWLGGRAFDKVGDVLE
jgi:hypothetical protein